MYSPRQLLTAVRHPKRGFHELNRLYHSRLNTRPHNPGVDILAEDWDNLVILDACRYDMFEQLNNIEGKLSSKTSQGSSTVEFLHANFQNEVLHDTVYVTANPQFFRHEDVLGTIFHHVDNVWNDEGWDEHEQTVLPETLTNRALRAVEEFSEKRLIIHYIQPHYPFIGSDWGHDTGYLEQVGQPDPWRRIFLRDIEVSDDQIWEYYTNNLEVAMPYVDELVDALTGKTIVTSDHGNMVGERSFPIPIRDWGHPDHLYTEPLVKVPWLECPYEARRETTSEQPQRRANNVDDKQVEERLNYLGYA